MEWILVDWFTMVWFIEITIDNIIVLTKFEIFQITNINNNLFFWMIKLINFEY